MAETSGMPRVREIVARVWPHLAMITDLKNAKVGIEQRDETNLYIWFGVAAMLLQVTEPNKVRFFWIKHPDDDLSHRSVELKALEDFLRALTRKLAKARRAELAALLGPIHVFLNVPNNTTVDEFLWKHHCKANDTSIPRLLALLESNTEEILS